MIHTEVIVYEPSAQWAALKLCEFLARTDRRYRNPHEFTCPWTQAVVSNA